ncbi:VOC family protein [Brachybacterium sp. YJGR34]|uniref:VOC family protein n=1 Tax=Brachybacterium sp. YJGR34 TaxID=2059911 RepID=UPI000E0C75D8|nr:VOC family protein [Brachybacterium sp. YJGR34]
MTRIRTCLWFDGRVDEAAAFYTSLLPDSRIVGSMPYTPTDNSPGSPPAGESLTVEIELAGVPYVLLNGGPMFPQTEAASIEVTVGSQEELDRLWDALIADGGQESQCGWCRDRFGVSWQVIPQQLYDLLAGPQAAAVTAEMLTQQKLDVERLEAAARG